MNLKEIKAKAKQLNIKPGKMKKKELIQAIQKAENNIVCYGSNRAAYCGEDDCLWRRDCDISDGEE